jgi:hypothetical protein
MTEFESAILGRLAEWTAGNAEVNLSGRFLPLFGSFKHLVQTQWVYPSANLLNPFILNALWSWLEVSSGDCSRFCSCKSVAFQLTSTPSKFLLLNLKEFQELRRVEHLVPNQIVTPIETY